MEHSYTLQVQPYWVASSDTWETFSMCSTASAKETDTISVSQQLLLRPEGVFVTANYQRRGKWRQTTFPFESNSSWDTMETGSLKRVAIRNHLSVRASLFFLLWLHHSCPSIAPDHPSLPTFLFLFPSILHFFFSLSAYQLVFPLFLSDPDSSLEVNSSLGAPSSPGPPLRPPACVLAFVPLQAAMGITTTD